MYRINPNRKPPMGDWTAHDPKISGYFHIAFEDAEHKTQVDDFEGIPESCLGVNFGPSATGCLRLLALEDIDLDMDLIVAKLSKTRPKVNMKYIETRPNSSVSKIIMLRNFEFSPPQIVVDNRIELTDRIEPEYLFTYDTLEIIPVP